MAITYTEQEQSVIHVAKEYFMRNETSGLVNWETLNALEAIMDRDKGRDLLDQWLHDKK